MGAEEAAMNHDPINLREAQIQRLVVSGFRFQYACHYILTIHHAAGNATA